MKKVDYLIIQSTDTSEAKDFGKEVIIAQHTGSNVMAVLVGIVLVLMPLFFKTEHYKHSLMKIAQQQQIYGAFLTVKMQSQELLDTLPM